MTYFVKESGLCLIVCFLVYLCPCVKATERPNILLVVSEDNGPELGCYDDPYAQTPNLDRLASEGICFQRAYVPQSGCSQSRASFFTGLYPHQHGQIGLATWGFRLFRDDTPNLPTILKAAGYRTGIIGKLHINPVDSFSFDFHEIKGANFQRKNMGDYATFAKQFISSSETPFFLSVNYPEAHDPWITQVDDLPKTPLKREDVRPMPYMGLDSPALRQLVADYYNCISRLDSLVGDLMDVLENSGKAHNTIVIYLGDHGADMLRGKRTCYEGGLRIPLIMKWPEHIPPSVNHQLVSTLDIMPTILSALKLDLPAELAGRPLQPLFKPEGHPQAHWRDYFFAEYHTHAAAPNYFPQRSVCTDRYKLILSLLPGTTHPDYQDTMRKLEGDHESSGSSLKFDLEQMILHASSDVKTAYRIMRVPPAVQLYDLKADPHEFVNLAGNAEYADIQTKLLSKLKQWRVMTNDPLLSENVLTSLTKEVQSVKTKSVARKHHWKYPDYFFGPKPNSTNYGTQNK